ncbi:methyltransferase [Azorhizobium doebereinerae]|uniref:methyltransferase n=1 Tax=Azorhizobium doebereinerae TaxID=281091 RepID=UPI0004213AFE|nr:methyltransferase [Azorhizobium doebereinerae]
MSQEHLALLSVSEMSGSELRLSGQLDRQTYIALDKVLKAAGGKWDRKAKGHVFDGDAADAIEPILLTGEVQRVKQDFGQFDTPPALAARLVALAKIEAGMKVLEPSAGIGNIALAAAAFGAMVMCYEIDAKRCDALAKASGRALYCLDMVVHRDFLGADPAPVYDRVVMNPPFARQADIDHVRHAAKFLKPGGRLVAIMSAGISFPGDLKATAFREFVAERGGTIAGLPADSFKAAGTSVNTALVLFDAPASVLNAKGA